MWRERIVPALKAVFLSAIGVAALFVALTNSVGSYSMVLGLAGVLALAGSTLLLVFVYLNR